MNHETVETADYCTYSQKTYEMNGTERNPVDLRRGSIFVLITAILVLLFVPVLLRAENCTTVVPDWLWKQELERAKSGFEYPPVAKSSVHYRIPVVFHIVRMSDGSGPAGPCEGTPPDTLPHPGVWRTGQIDTALTDLNRMFAQVGLEFFHYGAIDYIDDDCYYCMQITDCDIYGISQINPVSEAINVYVAPNTGIGGESIYWTGRQAILIDAANIGVPDNPSTLAHEIGHYLNLLHTHTIRGFYPGPYTFECPDGSNCETEGDLICDTPADPDLGGRMDLECNYILPAAPPPGCDNTPYNPQLNNLMSYAPPCCRDYFTPEQIAKMIYTLENERPELAFEPLDIDDSQERLPENFALRQNYPNPFNPSTFIEFSLPYRARVNIDIYNILGRRVCRLAAKEYGAGSHRVEWDGRTESGEPAGSGVYFYRFEAGGQVETRKMMLMK